VVCAVVYAVVAVVYMVSSPIEELRFKPASCTTHGITKPGPAKVDSTKLVVGLAWGSDKIALYIKG
jgi:hypothetical protein